MNNQRSCVGCKFLYERDSGYSNYTVTDTDVLCAKDKNPNLPKEKPYDWTETPDNWPATRDSRCDQFSPGPRVGLDVDGEVGPADCTNDEEAIEAICKHAGTGRDGGQP